MVSDPGRGSKSGTSILIRTLGSEPSISKKDLDLDLEEKKIQMLDSSLKLKFDDKNQSCLKFYSVIPNLLKYRENTLQII